MKPRWEDAPSWAHWMAMDESGDWCWYEQQPAPGLACWKTYGRYQLAMEGPVWEKTLAGKAMIELKPCPFCGAQVEPIDENEQFVLISCRSCGCDGPWVKGISPMNAATLWNNRVGLIQPDVGVLVEALEKIARVANSEWIVEIAEDALSAYRGGGE